MTSRVKRSGSARAPHRPELVPLHPHGHGPLQSTSSNTSRVHKSVAHITLQNRWLLVEFLDPASFAAPGSATSPSNLQLLDEKKIWASLKSNVLLNFGDTGWGAVGQSLTGIVPLCEPVGLDQSEPFSEILFSSNSHLYHPSRSRSSQDCLGCCHATDCY